MTSLIEESVAAARGMAALLVGRREAGKYFQFGPRGIVGSFIALLAVLALTTYLPVLLGVPSNGSLAVDLILLVLLYGIECGFAAIVLKQLGRMDGFFPYLVADNWVTALLTLALTVLALVGMGQAGGMVLGIAGLVIKVNTARLIVTLSPVQVVIFVLAQLAAAFLWLVLLYLILPASTWAALAG